MYNLRVFACYLVHWLSNFKIKMGKWWGWCDTVVSMNNYKDTDVVIEKSQGKYQKSIFSHKVFYWIIFRFRPHQNADPSRPRVAAVIDTLISFKNNDLGAWIRGGDIIIKNSGWDISLAMIQFVLVWQFAQSLPVNRGSENKGRMSSQQKNIF